MGQAAWQNNIYCKQGLQRKAKESSLVSGKSDSQRKKKYIYICGRNAVCGYVDLTSPVIKTSDDGLAPVGVLTVQLCMTGVTLNTGENLA